MLEIRTGRSLQKWRRADSPDVLVRCHPSRVGENSILADSESRAFQRTRTRSHAHATCHLTKVDTLLGHPSALLTTFRQELALVRLQVGDQSRLFPVCSPLPFLRSPHGRLAILFEATTKQNAFSTFSPLRSVLSINRCPVRTKPQCCLTNLLLISVYSHLRSACPLGASLTIAGDAAPTDVQMFATAPQAPILYQASQ